MKFLYRFILTIVVIGLLSLTWSCNGKVAHDSIPEVPVNVYLDVNSTMFIELNTIGGWVYLTGGYRGILVYRVSVDDFVAYDRACPYDPFEPCSRITVDPSGITVTDSCCGSQFGILDGSVIQGPATIPLKRFYTYFDGNILTVNN
jgi:nitrite reductase/ring-hydroxylating ferredoxin subunit